MPADPLAAGPERPQAVREMFDRIAPRYRRMNRIMTLGLDGRWRAAAVRALQMPPGSLVVDIGCGPGELCQELERHGHRAIGFDLSEGMLRAASGRPVRVLADGLRLPLPDASADGATCGFVLRNVADPAALFKEVGRVLRNGARVALLEVAAPTWQPAHALHRLYFHGVVPVMGAVLSDRRAYRYLPASSALLPTDDALAQMAEAAGFQDYRRRHMGLGAVQLVTATRRA
jgi:demethylmenaquinone methyltransferase / 2-methoxy-6-polyprenyl-1,4-benzoquinol methylase